MATVKQAKKPPTYASSYHGVEDETKFDFAMKKIVRFLSGDKSPENTLDTIPFEAMYPDGICRVKGNYYSKMIQFFDINYQLARNEEKQGIFSEYCEFLNYFDESIHFQFLFINQPIDQDMQTKAIVIPPQDDSVNEVREEYSQMLCDQMAKGNNGIIRSKYIVFGIDADNKKAAITRLAKIETDVLNRFKILRCKATPVNGIDRLRIMHDYMNQDNLEPFQLKKWKDIKDYGLTPKSSIQPTSFDFRNTQEFKIGNMWGTGNYLSIDAAEMSDEMLMGILNMEDSMAVTFHIDSINQADAMKFIKGKLADINKMKIEEQKKAIRAGYDMDIIPPDIETYSEATHDLLQELQSRNERLFKVSIYIVSYSEKYKDMKEFRFALKNYAQSASCTLKSLDHMQEEVFKASLPLGMNFLPDINRNLTTSSTAVFVPFTTQELFMDSPEAEYLGLNALSNGLIMADRKLLNNPNGLILGKPGSGKSFAAKRSILNSYLITNDDILICDPEAEYYPLVTYLNGQVIKISQQSNVYINPLDINIDIADDEDPVSLKADFILSMMELIINRSGGMLPEHKSAIDMAIRYIYRDYLDNPKPENMPVLQDLYDFFMEHAEGNPINHYLAQCLYIYCEGSNNVFNHRTNVDINNRIVCFDIKELGTSLKKLGMLIVQESVWDRVKINRQNKKHTRYFIDEFHLLLRDEQTAAYSVEIWKRFRKWGGIPTGITQNIKDFLGSKEVENIFDNSDFVYMLNQGSGDAEILADKFNISSHLLKYITNVGQGEGLIFFGDIIQPFVDRFPTNTTMYKLLTTKLEETISEEDVQKK